MPVSIGDFFWKGNTLTLPALSPQAGCSKVEKPESSGVHSQLWNYRDSPNRGRQAAGWLVQGKQLASISRATTPHFESDQRVP